jgi:hypothetical protein
MNCKNYGFKLVVSILISLVLIGLMYQVKEAKGQDGTSVSEPLRIKDWVGRMYSYQAYADSLSLGAAGLGTATTYAVTAGPWTALSLYVRVAGTVDIDSVVLVQSPTNLSAITSWCKIAKLEFVNKNSSSPQKGITAGGYFLCNLNTTGMYPVEFFRLIFYKGTSNALNNMVFLRVCGWNQF